MVRVIADYTIEDDFTESIMVIKLPAVPKTSLDFLGARGAVHEEADDGSHGPWAFSIQRAPDGRLFAHWDNDDWSEQLDIQEPVAVGSTIVRINAIGVDPRHDLYIIREIQEDV